MRAPRRDLRQINSAILKVPDAFPMLTAQAAKPAIPRAPRAADDGGGPIHSSVMLGVAKALGYVERLE
jgi:hypothetical protein